MTNWGLSVLSFWRHWNRPQAACAIIETDPSPVHSQPPPGLSNLASGCLFYGAAAPIHRHPVTNAVKPLEQ
jgi:hypothetical protein